MKVDMPIWLWLLIWLGWVACIIAIFYLTKELAAMKALQGVAL